MQWRIAIQPSSESDFTEVELAAPGVLAALSPPLLVSASGIGVRFGVGVVAESNDQAASDAAVRAVTPGARSQDTKTIVDFLRKRQAGKRFAEDQTDGSKAPSL